MSAYDEGNVLLLCLFLKGITDLMWQNSYALFTFLLIETLENNLFIKKNILKKTNTSVWSVL